MVPCQIYLFSEGQRDYSLKEEHFLPVLKEEQLFLLVLLDLLSPSRTKGKQTQTRNKYIHTVAWGCMAGDARRSVVVRCLHFIYKSPSLSPPSDWDFLPRDHVPVDYSMASTDNHNYKHLKKNHGIAEAWRGRAIGVIQTGGDTMGREK